MSMDVAVMEVWTKLKDELVPKLEKMAAGAQVATAGLKKTEKATSALTSTFKKLIVTIYRVIEVMILMASYRVMVSLVKGAIQVRSEFELMEMSIRSFGVSAKDASILFQHWLDLAAQTPLSVRDIVQAAIRLRTWKLVSLESVAAIKKMDDQLRLLASVSRVTGVQVEQMIDTIGRLKQGIFLSRMVAAARLDVTRIRAFLEENRDIVSQIFKEYADDFGRLAEDIAQAQETQLSNIYDSWIRTLDAIGRALQPAVRMLSEWLIGEDGLGGVLGRLRVLIMEHAGDIESWAKNLLSLIRVLGRVISFISRFWGALAGLVAARMIPTVIGLLGTLAATFWGVTTSAVSATVAVANFARTASLIGVGGAAAGAGITAGGALAGLAGLLGRAGGVGLGALGYLLLTPKRAGLPEAEELAMVYEWRKKQMGTEAAKAWAGKLEQTQLLALMSQLSQEESLELFTGSLGGKVEDILKRFPRGAGGKLKATTEELTAAQELLANELEAEVERNRASREARERLRLGLINEAEMLSARVEAQTQYVDSLVSLIATQEEGSPLWQSLNDTLGIAITHLRDLSEGIRGINQKLPSVEDVFAAIGMGETYRVPSWQEIWHGQGPLQFDITGRPVMPGGASEAVQRSLANQYFGTGMRIQQSFPVGKIEKIAKETGSRFGGKFWENVMAAGIGGAAGGGWRGAIAGALGVAGAAFGPVGAAVGGLLGTLFGRGRRRGETPSAPVYTKDVAVVDLLSILLNITKAGLVGRVNTTGVQALQLEREAVRYGL